MVEALAKIPDVEVDADGTFKYILVRVKVKDGSLGKDIVRGTKSAQYHSKLKCVRTHEPNRFKNSHNVFTLHSNLIWVQYSMPIAIFYVFLFF